MGACYDERRFPGEMNHADLKREFAQAQAADRYENGHSYSGTIGMAQGLKIHNRSPFASEREARDWLEDRVQKWEAAEAVRCLDRSGKTWWIVGALCSS